MAIRWECPTSKHPGVLGPERPRKENACRYCLPCTAETGKLTERVAPVLARKRAQAEEKAKAARATEAARKAGRRTAQRATRAERVTEAKRGATWLLDCDHFEPYEEANVIFRASETLRDHAKRNRPKGWRPEITVARSDGAYCSGHCKVSNGGKIHLTLGRAPVIRARYVLLHELVHAVLPRRTLHAEAFRSALSRVAWEVYGVWVHPDRRVEESCRWMYANRAYELDELIQEAMAKG